MTRVPRPLTNRLAPWTSAARLVSSANRFVAHRELGLRLVDLSCVFVALSLVLLRPVAAQEPSPVRGPREMLQVMRIDASQLRFFQDDRLVAEEEIETLLQLLFRLPGFAQADADRWTKQNVDWAEVARNPDSYRFELLQLDGNVTHVQRRAVVRELARRLRFSEYYELTLKHDDRSSQVFVRRLPQTWVAALDRGETPRERVRIQGLLLKRLPSDETPGFMFATSRIQWLPTVPNPTLAVTEGKVLLSELGFDVTRLDEVEHRAAIGGADRECFYQMLAAVREADPSRLRSAGRQEFDIARLIQTPNDAVGDLYTLQGLARRVIRIEVPDQDIRDRFGIDHYYEMEVFLPLPRQVRFQDANDPVGKLFTEYPFVVCIPDVPGNIEVGEDVRVPVRFTGFFMKIWAYRTQFMSGDQPRAAPQRLQLSPLLIGSQVQLRETPAVDSSAMTITIAWVLAIGLVLLWLVLWRAGRNDKQRAKLLFRKHEPKSDGFDGIP